ncbi:MAG: hypothetical protein OXI90_08505 [Gammaproteobacteria bacterium]|nr:hypothetical protein [Gammaproteobacteria bacterium]
MVRNLTLFFAGTFVLTTTFDLWTTWVGVHQYGYTETNPLTDTSSIRAMANPEIVTAFIGMAMVAAGARYSKTLRPLPDEKFTSYYKRFLSINLFDLVVLFPILLAVVRVVPVLSNTSLILFDFGLFGVDTPWVDLVVMIVFFMIFTRPTTYFIYLICRASKP